MMNKNRTESFVERLNDLVGDVDVDLDAPLSMDDE